MRNWSLFNIFIYFIFLVLIVNNPAFSEEKVQTINSDKTKILHLTYYFDSREYNTFNILTIGQLPYGFHLFGFIDVHSNQKEPNERFDLKRYFLEYRLIYLINPDLIFGIKEFRFNMEYNDAIGKDNSMIRAGLSIKQMLPYLEKSWIEVRYFPYESDDTGTQACTAFLIKITDRIYVNGFADLNIDKNGKNYLVTEPQLNFVIDSIFEFAVEYRYNGYEDFSKLLDGTGIAFGLRIKL